MRWRLRWIVPAALMLLVVSACGDDDSPLLTEAGPETSATTTDAGATTATSAAGTTVTTTTLPETTTSPGSIAPADQRCSEGGGLWLPQEGDDGVCSPAGAITAEPYVIRQVALDDTDGGLLVWTGPGAPGSKVPQPSKYQQVGVIPPFADGVQTTGHATADDFWYHVRYGGFEGWARSAFLAPAASAPALPACLTGSVGPLVGATGATSSTGDFDGAGGDDTFTVYWDGVAWVAHMRTAYGFHAEAPTDPHYGTAPGTGPQVSAAQVTDLDGDGRDEAWVGDSSPAAGELLSLYAFFNQGCTLHHVTHHDNGLPVLWVIGATVTHADALECITGGVAAWTGAATGVNDYAGDRIEHTYLYSDGLAAEFYFASMTTFDTAAGDVMPNGFTC